MIKVIWWLKSTDDYRQLMIKVDWLLIEIPLQTDIGGTTLTAKSRVTFMTEKSKKNDIVTNRVLTHPTLGCSKITKNWNSI